MIVLLPEHAELSHRAIAKLLGVSPTAVAMARRRAAGLCRDCDKPATIGVLCETHYKRTNRSRRKRDGTKPWTPGSKGRPPLNAAQPPEGIQQ